MQSLCPAAECLINTCLHMNESRGMDLAPRYAHSFAAAMEHAAVWRTTLLPATQAEDGAPAARTPWAPGKASNLQHRPALPGMYGAEVAAHRYFHRNAATGSLTNTATRAMPWSRDRSRRANLKSMKRGLLLDERELSQALAYWTLTSTLEESQTCAPPALSTTSAL